MKTPSKLFALALTTAALTAGGLAHAQSPAINPDGQGLVPTAMVYETAVPDNTPLTRDQVKAELVAARADGELSTASDNQSWAPNDFMATRSRTEVRDEIALARADHELNTASDNQPVERVFFVSDKTRAEVIADTTAAMSSGKGLSQGDHSEYEGQPETAAGIR